MKKLALLAVLLAFTTSIAAAAEPAEIGFDFQVTAGEDVVLAARTTLTEGLESTLGMEREAPYRAKTTVAEEARGTSATMSPGITLRITPTLEPDGRITLDLTVREIDLVSSDTAHSNSGETQMPSAIQLEIHHVISAQSGQPVVIPLEAVSGSDTTVRDGQPTPPGMLTPHVLQPVATRR